jgi:hypothetical protein
MWMLIETSFERGFEIGLNACSHSSTAYPIALLPAVHILGKSIKPQSVHKHCTGLVYAHVYGGCESVSRGSRMIYALCMLLIYLPIFVYLSCAVPLRYSRSTV